MLASSTATASAGQFHSSSSERRADDPRLLQQAQPLGLVRLQQLAPASAHPLQPRRQAALAVRRGRRQLGEQLAEAALHGASLVHQLRLAQLQVRLGQDRAALARCGQLRHAEAQHLAGRKRGAAGVDVRDLQHRRVDGRVRVRQHQHAFSALGQRVYDSRQAGRLARARRAPHQVQRLGQAALQRLRLRRVQPGQRRQRADAACKRLAHARPPRSAARLDPGFPFSAPRGWEGAVQASRFSRSRSVRIRKAQQRQRKRGPRCKLRPFGLQLLAQLLVDEPRLRRDLRTRHALADVLAQLQQHLEVLQRHQHAARRALLWRLQVDRRLGRDRQRHGRAERVQVPLADALQPAAAGDLEVASRAGARCGDLVRQRPADVGQHHAQQPGLRRRWLRDRLRRVQVRSLRHAPHCAVPNPFRPAACARAAKLSPDRRC
jgi:hypothetical protein